MTRRDRTFDALYGGAVGAVLGVLGGWGLCAWVMTGPPLLFTGDTVLAGAVIFGGIGWKIGARSLRDELGDALEHLPWWW